MESNVRKLSIETVSAIVQHICQTLPVAHDKYCFPLLFDYVKTLATVLQYKPHVEHLSHEEIQTTVSFGLDLASDVNHTVSQDGENSLGSPGSSNGQKALSFRQSASSSKGGGSGKRTRVHDSTAMLYPQLQNSGNSIILCLQYISSVPTSNLLDQAERIFDVLFDLLQYYPNVNSLQQPAFETIDHLLPNVLMNRTSLGLNAIRKILALIPSFWQNRALGMKEVLLSLLLHSESVMQRIIPGDMDKDFSSEVSLVVEVLRQEYCERRMNDCLLPDDLDMSDYVNTFGRSHLNFKLANVRPGLNRADEAWALIHTSASMILALNELHSIKSIHEHEESGPRTKRQRLATPLNELLNMTKSPHILSKVYALQVLAVIFETYEFDVTELREYLETFLSCMSEDDGTIASWAIFAVAW